MGFAEIVATWKDYGVFEFYLPFVLMFAIFYGLLRRSKIFGESADRHATNINVIVSIVAALFVMVYTPAGVTLTVFFGTFFTQTMVILTTVLCFALILYMLLPPGAAENLLKDPAKYVKILVPFAAIIVFIIFFSAGGLEIFGLKLGGVGGVGISGLNLSTEDVVFTFLVLLFALVILFIIGGEGGGKGKNVIGYRPTPIYEGEKI
jgi:hypothetical protein